MKRGAAIVNKEELTQQQIKVELNKVELKYRLDNLGADLLQETEDWHLFMLEARLDGKKRREQIKRQPTKAENEEQVSEADRKKHEQIAAAVEQKLKAIAGSDDVASFEELYAALKTEAKQLVKTYQLQLRKGIKIAIDLVNAVEKDKKDGDVDIRVKIAPNTIIKVTSIGFNPTLSEKELEKCNREFVEAAHVIVDDAYDEWGDRDISFDGKEAASNSVHQFFLQIMAEIEEYRSANMEGFKGINCTLNGEGTKRKIKIKRETESIGIVAANYEYIKEKKGDDNEELHGKIRKLLKIAEHTHPKDYSRGKHWKGNSESERQESSTNKGPGQYMYSFTGSMVKNLEREAFLKGKIVDKGSGTYHAFYTFIDAIGYANGKKTKTIRAELTGAPYSPTIHSHPR